MKFFALLTLLCFRISWAQPSLDFSASGEITIFGGSAEYLLTFFICELAPQGFATAWFDSQCNLLGDPQLHEVFEDISAINSTGVVAIQMTVNPFEEIHSHARNFGPYQNGKAHAVEFEFINEGEGFSSVARGTIDRGAWNPPPPTTIPRTRVPTRPPSAEVNHCFCDGSLMPGTIITLQNDVAGIGVNTRGEVLCARFASPTSLVLVEFEGWSGGFAPISSCNCGENDAVTKTDEMYFVDCGNFEKVQDCGTLSIEHATTASQNACSNTLLDRTCATSITCELGYRLANSANSQPICGVLGSWDAPLPECVRVTCDWDAHVLNLDSEACHGTLSGEVCDQFVCREGYRFKSAKQTMECGHDGLWIGSDQVECARFCDTPEIAHSNVNEACPVNFEGDTCEFSCNDKYVTQLQQNVLTCQSNGEWDLNPSCQVACEHQGSNGIDPCEGGGANVCAKSKYLIKACHGPATHEVSEDICATNDMRLCSIEELENDETNDSGCGYDNVLTWSSTPCGGGGFYVAPGGTDGRLGDVGRSCVSELEEHYTRCCSEDTSICIRDGVRKPGMDFGDPNICAVSNFLSRRCMPQVTQREAEQICADSLMRLCTLAEVEAEEADDSGCNLDVEMIWTSSPCNFNRGFMAATGGVAKEPEDRTKDSVCASGDDLYYVRCCTDTERPQDFDCKRCFPPQHWKSCCTEDNPCPVGRGDCQNNDDCDSGLICGDNNCRDFDSGFGRTQDCCVPRPTAAPTEQPTDAPPPPPSPFFWERGG